MWTRLWHSSPPLTATALVMLVALAGAVAGLIVDPRIITGAPAWLKPAKFAVSIAIYTLTLAWIFSLIPEWTRMRRIVGWTTAITLILEVVIIDLQAFRGTTSHFSVGTPLDGILFTIMGAAILVQTLSTIAVAVALWRHQFADAAVGWALRLGMTITIVGALTGGLMVRPTQDQLAAARAGRGMPVAGAHTVGAPDGGPGLPGTGWSTGHGDVRVPHFLGLHALQTVPIVVLLLPRRRLTDLARARLAVIAGLSYAALFGILLSQALRGHSVVSPDPLTLTLLTMWGLATAAAAVSVVVRPKLARSEAII